MARHLLNFLFIVVAVILVFGIIGATKDSDKRFEDYCRLVKQYDETGGKAGKKDFRWQRPLCKEEFDWF